ncbi:hypothetical protein [Pelosinus sp. IPA-1]|uniref:hypothetical protein n=1 Tax=Pelosinus sp. IPA-1 TaxID=3029569 RepID=UPI0024361508|nr:hypothetical protein [Pelosinus sp. IPA-1]GMB00943.1 hypothetical protein PIPA1_37420 [Pelosinus sp. IPA-1]
MVFIGLLSILGIIICLIGTIVMAIKRNKLWKKWLLGSLGCFVLLVTVALIDSPQSTTTTKDQPPQTTTSVQENQQQPLISSQPTTSQERMEPKEQLEKIIKDSTKDKFKKVSTVVRADGKLASEIYISGNENLTIPLTRKGIYRDGADLFEKIYTSGLPIYEIREYIHLPLTDKYGNTSDSIVVRMTLKPETAAKINWKNVDKLDFANIVDNSWTHPALLKE